MKNVTVANITLEISRIEGLLKALKSRDVSTCTIDGQKALLNASAEIMNEISESLEKKAKELK